MHVRRALAARYPLALAVAAALFAALSAAQSAQPLPPAQPRAPALAPRYTAQVLASPFTAGNTSTRASSLNDAGQLAGSGFQSLWPVGLVWPEPGTYVDLSAAHGLGYSEATAIDGAGRFVGAAAVDPTTTKPTAFVANLAGAPTFLPQLVQHPWIASIAIDVSDTGLVVGACDSVPTQGLSGNPHQRAVLWSGGPIQDLGTLGGDYSLAKAVNDAGVVVGISNLAPGGLVRGFRWTATLGMEQLQGFAPGARTWAEDVNALGEIAGDADTPTGRAAVVWSDPQTFVVLPDLPGDAYSEAKAINDQGLVVGRGVSNESGARVWMQGRPHDLNALVQEPTLTLFEAVDVNEAGQILTHGFDTASSPWRAVSVVLTPW